MSLTRDQFNRWCKERNACWLSVKWMSKPENIDKTPRELLETCPHGSWLWWISWQGLELYERSEDPVCTRIWDHLVAIPVGSDEDYNCKVIDSRSMKNANWIRDNVASAEWDAVEDRIAERLATYHEEEIINASVDS